MVHLLPLQGAPRWSGVMEQVIDAAVRDAATLNEGGVDAIIVENYGDTPFHPGAVPPETVAAMTAAVVEVQRVVRVPVGVNVLRNDAAAALAICAATGADFIRVNVHTGAMITDQGWINGNAHRTLRLRAELGLEAAIFADVFVKHATPPAGLSITDAAKDTWERGQADAVIVSGAATGQPTSADDLRTVKNALPDAPVLIGSGITLQNAEELLGIADGAIVGTSLKETAGAQAPVSLEKVKSIVDVVSRMRR
jgi:membrane complex biogenesis BtpA family protein